MKNYQSNIILLSEKLKDAATSTIQIERSSKKITITIHSARPGIVIGKKGEGIEALRLGLGKLLNTPINNIHLNISEIKRPALVANLVGQNIAQQIVKKINYRRACKKSIQATMAVGAEGIRVCVAGRLNGAEIARSETFREGRVPLHTLRAKIDYAHVEANTTYGIIGVKVWIYNDK